MRKKQEVYVLFLLPKTSKDFNKAKVAGVYSSEALAMHDMAQHTNCDMSKVAIEKCNLNEFWAKWNMKL